VAAAVSNMVPSGAVAFWRSGFVTVFWYTGQSQHVARAWWRALELTIKVAFGHGTVNEAPDCLA